MEVAIYCGKMFSWVNICNKVKDWSTITRLDESNVLSWLSEKGKDSYLIFGVDVVPHEIYNAETEIAKTPLFSFIERRGTVIWLGDSPFSYVERGGEKIPSTPFPSTPLQEFMEAKNSIVGDALDYKAKESWRAIFAKQDLIPISFVERNGQVYYSSWIYKRGKGYFVRLYDSKQVDVDYVLSFPERFSRLGFAFKITYRKFKDFKLILPKARVVLIVGGNNEGKTSILEALALIDRRNSEQIQKYRSTSKVAGEIEAFLDYKYVRIRGDLREGDQVSALLVYPSLLPYNVKYSASVLEKLSEVLSNFDRSIFYVYPSYNEETKASEIRVLYNDKKSFSIYELGEGYKTLVSFLAYYYLHKPDVLLIDDVEAFSFHPRLMKKFFDYLLELANEVKLIVMTTQSASVIHYLAEEAIVNKKEDSVIYLLLRNNYYVTLKPREVLEIEDYEDLRYYALEVRPREAS